MATKTVTTCPGPLVWFDVAATNDREQPAAVLECNRCDYIVTSGNVHADEHAGTPLLREGLAS